MKKFILGLVLFSVGFLGAIALIVSLICSPESPWYINGTQGIYVGAAFMKMQFPLGVCIVTSLSGLILAIIEAFSKK